MEEIEAQQRLLNQLIWNEQQNNAAVRRGAAAANEDLEVNWEEMVRLEEAEEEDDHDHGDGDGEGDGDGAEDRADGDVEGEDDQEGDGVLDGGIAVVPGATTDKTKTRAQQCLLVFFFECVEILDFAKDHPILKPGVVVSIGLNKSAKLSYVFERYIAFCNESFKDVQVSTSDLEFIHHQLLNGHDTPEGSALMKNDKIKVRKVRTAEREVEQERKRMQREADRNFFQQLRHLMPDLGGSKTADVILDCQGKLSDESGRNQQVLSSTVKAHSMILKKRCPWLGSMVRAAEMNDLQAISDKKQNTTSENNNSNSSSRSRCDRATSQVPQGSNLVQNDDVENADRRDDGEEDDDDDDDSAIVSINHNEKPETERAVGVAEIEDEDAAITNQDVHRIAHDESHTTPTLVPDVPRRAHEKKMVRIQLHHAPEAVKILLEYSYTNRVNSLGQEAFVQACRTKPQKHAGPIAPFPISSSGSRRWPKNGNPTVPFAVAIAGIHLADEAGLPRLSLMCEIAASQLLTPTNVIAALALCALQKDQTGNDLKYMRKAAMSLIFRNGPKGVFELGRTEAFKHGLEARRELIVPTLFQGTVEALNDMGKDESKVKDRYDINQLSFEVLDSEDKYRRARERKKRKLERIENDPNRQHEVDFEMEDIYDELSGWGSQDAPKRSLKRMAKHLETMTSRSMAAFQARSSRYGNNSNTPAAAYVGSRRSRRKSGHGKS